MAKVLELPELLESIFHHLADEKPSLTKIILVSRRWFDCATRVLWSEPPSDALAAIPDHDRRQLYASRICRLRFDGDEGDHHALFESLQFPSLKSLLLDSYTPADGRLRLRQYLQDSLEEFTFYGGPLDEDTLSYMAAHCFRLRTLLIDYPGDALRASPAFFKDFISRAASVEEMIFMFGMDQLLTTELLVCLAGRKNLKKLTWARLIEKSDFQEVADKVPSPFASIEHLTLRASSAVVPMLVPSCARLRVLSLMVSGDLTGVTERLSTLSGLQELSLLLEADTPEILEKKDVMVFKNMTNLTNLHIGRWGEGSSFPKLREFTDKDLDELVSKLSKLETLHWEAQCDLTSKALACLHKRCPSLEGCTFLSTLDLQELESDVVFPNMKELEIGGIQATAGVDETVELLRRIFPNLEDLEAGDDDFSSSVMDAWMD